MPRAKPLPDGIAQVEFDAGGQATSISPNPVRPALVKDKGGKEVLSLRWILGKLPLHGNAAFNVRFGNVVPCFKTDYFLTGLVSEGDLDGLGWTWTWPKPEGMPLFEDGLLLFYDVFFSYQPHQLLGDDGRNVKHRQLVQTTSLRQIMSTDPTVILPPKAGGG